jgi:hypothetical protein
MLIQVDRGVQTGGLESDCAQPCPGSPLSLKRFRGTALFI